MNATAVLAEIHEVIVGNVGTVYSGDDAREARLTYLQYRDLTSAGYGRCAYEPVTWMWNGDIYQEHQPEEGLEQ